MLFIANLKAAKTSGVQVKSFKMLETNRGIAWSCSVSLDGKKLGLVSNDGSGGETRFDFGADQQKQAATQLKNAGYKLELTIGEVTIEEPEDGQEWLDFALSQIGDELADLKRYKSKAKQGVYFEKKTAPTFAYVKGPDTEAFKAQIKAHYGDNLVRFLNDEIRGL